MENRYEIEVQPARVGWRARVTHRTFDSGGQEEGFALGAGKFWRPTEHWARGRARKSATSSGAKTPGRTTLEWLS